MRAVAKAVADRDSEHAVALADKDKQHASAMAREREEAAAALVRTEGDQMAVVGEMGAGHAAALAAKDDEHEAALAETRERESGLRAQLLVVPLLQRRLSDLEYAHAEAMEHATETCASMVVSKEREHEDALSSAHEAHMLEVSEVLKAHAAAMAARRRSLPLLSNRPPPEPASVGLPAWSRRS